MRRLRKFLRLSVFFLLVSLLLSSASLYADGMYQISEEELTQLMSNLEESETELANQKRLVEELQTSLQRERESLLKLNMNYDNLEKQQTLLQSHLLDSQNELEKAQNSLTVLRSEVNSSLNRQLWIGIGVGALIGLVMGVGVMAVIGLPM